jgi:hypothetical protein
LDAVWTLALAFFKEKKISDRFRNLKLSMFTDPKKPWGAFPRLKGKAAEVKTFGAALMHVFQSKMVPGEVHHRQILLLLKMSVRLEQIMVEQREAIRFDPPVADEFFQCAIAYAQLASALARRYNSVGISMFDITIKMHYLVHGAYRARHLNPRLGWCYGGEDFQNKVKRLGQSCVRGTAPWQLSVKFVTKYVFGLTLRILDRGGWFRR